LDQSDLGVFNMFFLWRKTVGVFNMLGLTFGKQIYVRTYFIFIETMFSS